LDPYSFSKRNPSNKQENNKLGLLFDPDDIGKALLRNVSQPLPDYIASYPRR
jgi:hypothetical protein